MRLCNQRPVSFYSVSFTFFSFRITYCSSPLSSSSSSFHRQSHDSFFHFRLKSSKPIFSTNPIGLATMPMVRLQSVELPFTDSIDYISDFSCPSVFCFNYFFCYFLVSDLVRHGLLSCQAYLPVFTHTLKYFSID